MLAGDRDYIVADMICTTAIQTYMNGKEYTPLLTQDKVDAAMKANREKALREYYNQPTRDGGVNQIVKWGTIRRNENFYLPKLCYTEGSNICLALDPARTLDNSILGAMNIVNDPNYGYIGEIVNCVNLFDKASKNGYKLDSNRQLKEIRRYLSVYNGQHNDYVNIDSLLVDQGAGGGGVSTYADGLLNDWVGDDGRPHRGLIDANHEIYAGYKELYPNAIDKLKLISPRKYRTQMVDEMIELMDLGVIKFPYEYKQEFITFSKMDLENKNEERIEDYQLSDKEIIALMNIDLMKIETTSIYKYENAEKTSKTYALAKDKESSMHDDRFYVLIMLAHRLYELRRGQTIVNKVPQTDYSSAPRCVSSISF